MGNTEQSLWKKLFKYLVSAVILLLGAGVSLVYIGKEYLVYAIIVVVCLSLFCIRKEYPVYAVILLFGVSLSLFYIRFAANGWCEYIGCIGVDKDPVRTAGVIFGAYLLIISMCLVIVRIRRTDRQIAETVRTNDLTMFHQGITMLNTGNAITQVGVLSTSTIWRRKRRKISSSGKKCYVFFVLFLSTCRRPRRMDHGEPKT